MLISIKLLKIKIFKAYETLEISDFGVQKPKGFCKLRFVAIKILYEFLQATRPSVLLATFHEFNITIF